MTDIYTGVNTTDESTLYANLREYLITFDLVRKPRDAGDAPPCWIDPKRGIPYPGQTEGLNSVEVGPTMVLAIIPATGIPSRPFEGFYQQRGAEIWYRAIKSPDIQVMHKQIRGVLHDIRNFVMNGLQINQSIMYRELQRVGSDERGYVYSCEYMFDLWQEEWPPA